MGWRSINCGLRKQRFWLHTCKLAPTEIFLNVIEWSPHHGGEWWHKAWSLSYYPISEKSGKVCLSSLTMLKWYRFPWLDHGSDSVFIFNTVVDVSSEETHTEIRHQNHIKLQQINWKLPKYSPIGFVVYYCFLFEQASKLAFSAAIAPITKRFCFNCRFITVQLICQLVAVLDLTIQVPLTLHIPHLFLWFSEFV